MATENLDWEDSADWGFGNIRLKRRFEILKRAIRFIFATDPGGISAGVVQMPSPQTLLLVDASAADVAYALPGAASVAGSRLEVKVTGGYACTLTPKAGELIDGQVSVETYTRLTLVSTGGSWVEL